MGRTIFKIRKQKEGEDRRDYLLKVAAAYIKQHCTDGVIWYDEAECDGYCVAEECEAESNSDDV